MIKFDAQPSSAEIFRNHGHGADLPLGYVFMSRGHLDTLEFQTTTGIATAYWPPRAGHNGFEHRAFSELLFNKAPDAPQKGQFLSFTVLFAVLVIDVHHGLSLCSTPSSKRPDFILPMRLILTTLLPLNSCPPSKFIHRSSCRPLFRSIFISFSASYNGSHSPHPLKKNGTLAPAHWSRIDLTQSGCMGRAFGPVSPPTITPSIFLP